MKDLLLLSVLGILLISGCVQEQPATPTTTVPPVPTTQAPTTTVAATPTTLSPATTLAPSMCPGQLSTKIKVTVGNLDTTDPFDQVAADFKVFNAQTGKYTGVAGTSATTGSVDVDVPCGYYYKILYTGATIYPTEEEIFATGSAVTTNAGARVIGTANVVFYSTQGTESTNTITLAASQKYNQLRVKVAEGTGNSFQDVVLLFNYDNAQIRSVKVSGKTQLAGVPTAFNTNKIAYETMDSLRNYQNAYYDVIVEAMPGISGTTNITVKAVDKSGYYKTVDTQNGIFQKPVPNTPTGMQNDDGVDIGATGAAQGEATLIVN